LSPDRPLLDAQRCIAVRQARVVKIAVFAQAFDYRFDGCPGRAPPLQQTLAEFGNRARLRRKQTGRALKDTLTRLVRAETRRFVALISRFSFWSSFRLPVLRVCVVSFAALIYHGGAEGTEKQSPIGNWQSKMIPVDGVLIIDKPAGMTSHDVVARVRKIIGERRVGHTGTLDPFATGVLVVLVGRATRLAQFLSGAEKEYEAVIRLGYATDTGDATGEKLEAPTNGFTAATQRAQSLRGEDIEVALASLRGEIEQTPPMYSARKIAGRKLYELARRGEVVERKAVRVKISEFETMRAAGLPLPQNDDHTCDLTVRVVCSAGTYIRTLAEDFGKRLGVGAHLYTLRRTRAGQFRIEKAITLERLNELAQSNSIEQALILPDAALSHLPAVKLSPDDVRRVRHGVDLQIEEAEPSGWSRAQAVRMRNTGGQLIAVGMYDESRHIVHPKVVISNE
jgi:tRNA pseudouridine55 synthase